MPTSSHLKMEPKTSFLILYGSQLGQAKSIAENIFSLACQHNVATQIQSLNDVKEIAQLKNLEVPIVIVTSTTGDGEAPENADKFLRKLKRRTLDSNALQGVQYSILGLGDTNFNNFCNCAKIVHKRFQEVGAQVFYPAAWIDDALGSDEAIDTWLDGLWLALTQLLGIQSKINSDSDLKMTSRTLPNCPESVIHINYCGVEDTPEINLLAPPQSYPSIDGSPQVASLSGARILTRDGSVKTTLEMKFTLQQKSQFVFEPGDAIGIVCPNPDTEVMQLLERLDIPMDKVDETIELSIKPGIKGSVPLFIPKKSTLRILFTHYVDIRIPPKKLLLRVLAEFTKDALEKSTLLGLSSREGSAEYEDKIRFHGVTIVDILLRFLSCRPSPEILLQHLPRLVPRFYSIASSPLESKNSIRIVFNLVIFPVSDWRIFPRLGLCTGWLSQLANDKGHLDQFSIQALSLTESKNFSEPNTPVTASIVFYKRSNHHFRLPTNPSATVIMVGPGTGVAPFIGFLEHREIEKSRGKHFGPMPLYFGCRNKEKDFIYGDVLERFQRSGLVDLYLARSRDGPNVPKYVQDLMENQEDDIVKALLDDAAYFYVCGDARNMAKEVRQKLTTCIQHVKGISETEAVAEISKLVDSKRYLQDVWT